MMVGFGYKVGGLGLLGQLPGLSSLENPGTCMSPLQARQLVRVRPMQEPLEYMRM